MKRAKLLFTLLLSAVLTLSLSACGNESNSAANTTESASEPSEKTGTLAYGGDLRFGIASDLTTLNPYNAADTSDGRSILFNMFEGLVRPDTDGNLEPAVAIDYKIEQGGKVYMFTLRPGLKFHSGAEVTTADVEYSLQTAINAGFRNFDKIESISVSDTIVTITLKNPDTDFLPNLTNAVIPKDYPDMEAHPIGTGPFAYDEYRIDQYLRLKKFDDYRQPDLPYLDSITYVFQADSNAIRLALEGGSIDGATVDYSLAIQLEDSGNFDMFRENSNSVQLLALNNAVKPLNDLRVRQAINYAIDRNGIIDTIFYGIGVQTGTPVIPGLTKYFNADLTNAYALNIEKAKELLADAGYPDGFDFEITVPSNYTMHVDTAQLIVNQLASINIKVTIKQVDWSTWLSDVYQGRNYEGTIVSLDGSTLSPIAYLARWVSTSGSNFANYVSAEYDAVYAEALETVDDDARVELFKKAQKILSDDSAGVFIQDISSFRVFRKGFGGAVAYPLYVFDASVITYTAP